MLDGHEWYALGDVSSLEAGMLSFDATAGK